MTIVPKIAGRPDAWRVVATMTAMFRRRHHGNVLADPRFLDEAVQAARAHDDQEAAIEAMAVVFAKYESRLRGG